MKYQAPGLVYRAGRIMILNNLRKVLPLSPKTLSPPENREYLDRRAHEALGNPPTPTL